MPQIQLSPHRLLPYRDDDFTEPWRSPETMLLLHGNHESGLAWNGWIPRLARRFRVIRPDMRGFGRSTPMPADYPWSLDGLIGDFVQLMDRLGIEKFHLAAAKFGGPLALRFAAAHPARARTLAVLGAPASGEARDNHVRGVRGLIERDGYEQWARATMPGRLGTNCAPEMLEGWYEVMRGTPMSTVVGFRRVVQGLDVTADLPHIACPALVITTEGSGSDFSVAMTRPWQERIPGSELLILPGDSYHVAATHPEVCARAVLDFIDRRTGAVHQP